MISQLTYQQCIDACLKAATACNLCAAACSREKNVQMMARCIQLNMECAAICFAAAQAMSMGGISAKAMCRICITICNACADECSRHHADHCLQCAEACRLCAEECRKLAI